MPKLSHLATRLGLLRRALGPALRSPRRTEETPRAYVQHQIISLY